MTTDILQLLVSGLATGAIYALVAIGFTLLWQTSQTINFAQGEFVMLPAFYHPHGRQSRLAVLGGRPHRHRGLGSHAGRVVQLVVVDPMIRHGVMPLVIATIGLAIVLKEGVKEFYSAQAQPFPPLAEATNIAIGGVVFSLQSIVNLAIAIAAVVVLQFFLSRTYTGRCMQATAQNPPWRAFSASMSIG